MHLKTHLYVTLVPGLYLAHCEKREGRGGEESARKKKEGLMRMQLPSTLFKASKLISVALHGRYNNYGIS